MKELSTEERVEILDRIHNADNAQAEAMSCVADYVKLDDDTLFDLLGVSSWSDIPAEPWPEDEPAPPAQKKRGPKPGAKKKKPKPPVETAATVKPKTPKTVALTAESAAIVAKYLEGSLQRDIREGLGGDWTLNDLRLLLFAQHMLSTYGED